MDTVKAILAVSQCEQGRKGAAQEGKRLSHTYLKLQTLFRRRRHQVLPILNIIISGSFSPAQVASWPQATTFTVT